MADGQQTLAREPKPNWRPLRPGETVHVLRDIVEEPEEVQDLSPVGSEQGIKTVSEAAPWVAPVQIPENIEMIVCETTERLVRELAPGIIERVIREEIEKLKTERN